MGSFGQSSQKLCGLLTRKERWGLSWRDWLLLVLTGRSDVVVPLKRPNCENIFRSVNIALVNEVKVIYSVMAIDVWEVIGAAKTNRLVSCR